MSAVKPIIFVKEETEIDPTLIEYANYLYDEERELNDLLLDLAKAISEKIYGVVRVYAPVGDYVRVEVYNDRFDFNYEFNKSFFNGGDIRLIVYDFLHYYREDILDRYLKKGGKS